MLWGAQRKRRFAAGSSTAPRNPFARALEGPRIAPRWSCRPPPAGRPRVGPCQHFSAKSLLCSKKHAEERRQAPCAAKKGGRCKRQPTKEGSGGRCRAAAARGAKGPVLARPTKRDAAPRVRSALHRRRPRSSSRRRMPARQASSFLPAFLSFVFTYFPLYAASRAGKQDLTIFNAMPFA